METPIAPGMMADRTRSPDNPLRVAGSVGNLLGEGVGVGVGVGIGVVLTGIGRQ